jgi:hypothetical protein
MSDNQNRGTGRTAKQIKDAPINSIFVWCNNNTYYPKHLARSIGRHDLNITRLAVDCERFLGVDSVIIVDHAAELSNEVVDRIQMLNSRRK